MQSPQPGDRPEAALPRGRRPGGRLAVGLSAGLTLLLLSGAVWLTRSGAGRALSGPAQGRARGYNLLLVTLDTVRADHLGCYGYAQARTPTIDALARTGVRWTQAISPVPLTLPAHATILTGLQVPAHGVRNNGTFRLAAAHVTLAEALRAAGYSTGAFVGAYVLDHHYGLAQGFDTYDDDCSRAGTPPAHSGYNERSAEAVTSAALAWLAPVVASGRPFFAWVHYYDAHHPYTPPERYARLSPDRPYDGEIAFVDAELGRLLDGLSARGSLERTVVALTADHGEGLGEHAQASHAYLVYDTTQRVPLVVSCPTLFERPQVVDDALADLSDVMPSLLDLLGLATPGRLDGRSLWSADRDPGRAVYVETMATLLDNGWASLHGLRRLHDKFILAPEPEYYDLATDPGETNNLYPRSPPQARELEERLKTLLQGWPPLESVYREARVVPQEEAERLASLGYLGGSVSSPPAFAPDPKRMMANWDRMMRADELSLAGRHGDALAEIEAALAVDPGNGKGWHIAALVHKRLGRMAEAEACLRRGLALKPTAEGYLALAQFLLSRGVAGGEFDQALLEAEELDPGYGAIHVTRGDRLALAGDFAAAIVEFERALELDPSGIGTVARTKIEQARQRLR